MHRCHKVQLVNGTFGGEGNTMIAIIKTITNDSYVNSMDSASLSQGLVIKETYSGEKAILQ